MPEIILELAEGRTVDQKRQIAKEFTDMLVAQRGFQANGRVITTSDQMLNDLVQLTP